MLINYLLGANQLFAWHNKKILVNKFPCKGNHITEDKRKVKYRRHDQKIKVHSSNKFVTVLWHEMVAACCNFVATVARQAEPKKCVWQKNNKTSVCVF